MKKATMGIVLCVMGCGNAAVTPSEPPDAMVSSGGGASPKLDATVAVPQDRGSQNSAQNATCCTDKISVSKAQACESDGSLEFCIAKADASLAATVMSIAPSATMSSSRGRAGCDGATEWLVTYPTSDPQLCPTRHGELVDAAWHEICALSCLDAIRAIVPTWFE